MSSSSDNVSDTSNHYVPYSVTKLRFDIFFHPHVCAFIEALNHEKGTSSLLTLDGQKRTNEKPPSIIFKDQYAPYTTHVDSAFPVENVDFRPSGPYSIYNWETFFHIPLKIGMLLSRNQKFADAQKWFHYIFNPTETRQDASPQRYWDVLPFWCCTEGERIENLLEQAAKGQSTASACQQDLNDQLAAWADDPFNPHLIARMRLIAYQKCTVMKYLDNLFAWGDQLFNQNTRESINEATQLYILASQILGPRPELIPTRGATRDYTYHDLVTLGLNADDPLSDPLVSLENEFPFSSGKTPQGGSGGPVGTSPTAFYFCIPQNDNLLGYWDTVADRLFKIRNCMNIGGTVQDLPLFAPPIDPALLVRAAAMGVDISSALSDINVATPLYRFTYMVQKALELCSDVKALGGGLLSAFEKRDAEALATLRAGQETDLLRAVKDVKTQQITEAQYTLDGLNKSRDVITARRDYYQNIVRITPEEQANIDGLSTAHTHSQIAQGISAGVAAAHMVPDFMVGSAGFSSPYAVAKWGGQNLGNALTAGAEVLRMIAAQYSHDAMMASIMGSHDRQWTDWKQQEKVANKELLQIEPQIAAAEVRVAVATLELENHQKQVDNASAIEDFLREKYTNQDLYDWMASQSAGVFFQTYKLAYDIAKRAERAYQFERGLTTSNYVNFGYWDSLRKGLLSGEQLYFDLKRLEMAYLDQNKREFELTKHVSLLLHDPLALIRLKETGQCEFELPEALFDADFPGHFMRRHKSVSLTIPCVAGPYAGVNCTLTLLSNKTRIRSALLSNGSAPSSPYLEDFENEDNRFVTNFSAMQSIATSHAQNDSGMFELNFRDERYLPFEGAGAISRWRLELNAVFPQFDHETISDVVLELRYTARDGGDSLKQAAAQALETALNDTIGLPLMSAGKGLPLSRSFSLRHEFPNEWKQLTQAPLDSESDVAITRSISLPIVKARFPFYLASLTLAPNSVAVIAVPKAQAAPPEAVTPFTPLTLILKTSKNGKPIELALGPPSSVGLLGSALIAKSPDGADLADIDSDPHNAWTFTLTTQSTTERQALYSELQDIVLVVRFTAA